MSDQMYYEDQMHEAWNGVSTIFNKYTESEQDLFKTIFEYGFRRGVYIGEDFIKNHGGDPYGSSLRDLI